MDPNGSNGSKWIIQLDPIGFNWIHLVSIWYPFGIHLDDPFGSIWIHLDPFDQFLKYTSWPYQQMDTNGYQMDTNGSKWIQMDPIGSFNWIQLDPIGSIWYPFGIHLDDPFESICIHLDPFDRFLKSTFRSEQKMNTNGYQMDPSGS